MQSEQQNQVLNHGLVCCFIGIKGPVWLVYSEQCKSDPSLSERGKQWSDHIGPYKLW